MMPWPLEPHVAIERRDTPGAEPGWNTKEASMGILARTAAEPVAPLREAASATFASLGIHRKWHEDPKP
eukprot:5836205-Amphidinium_carterae.1